MQHPIRRMISISIAFSGFLTHSSTSNLGTIDLSGNQLIGFVNATPGFIFTSCRLEPNLALECPFPSGCEACTCGTAPSCTSTCTGVGIYPGNWTPCPTTLPTPSATPSQTNLQSTSQSQQSSTSTISGLIVSSSVEYSVPVSVSSWIQDAGSVVTLSGQALSGVAITSQSVSLSGDLVLDVSALETRQIHSRQTFSTTNLSDGMAFILINATNITGQWQSVVTVQTSECVEYQVDVTYASVITATLSEVSLCGDAVKQAILAVFALL